MQKRIYVELPKENGPRFYYRNEALQKVKEELQSFLEWDKSMNNITFARKMMYSHELKANNQVEGYQDDLALIEDIIKRNVSSGLLLPKLTFLFISPFSLVRATFPVPIGYPIICLATYTPLADA